MPGTFKSSANNPFIIIKGRKEVQDESLHVIAPNKETRSTVDPT